MIRSPNEENQEALQIVTHRPAISFSTSFQHLFNRAGGRTSNVLITNEIYLLTIRCLDSNVFRWMPALRINCIRQAEVGDWGDGRRVGGGHKDLHKVLHVDAR